MMKKIGILLCLVLITGCTSTTQYLPLPDQSKTVDDPAKGRIYVIRPTRFGFAVPMDITDNGKPVGKTFGHSYLSWERPAGDTIIEGQAENKESLPLFIKEGRRVYVKQSVEMGIMMARNSLTPIDEETAKKYLDGLKPPKVGKA